jgi:hypothetical protein
VKEERDDIRDRKLNQESTKSKSIPTASREESTLRLKEHSDTIGLVNENDEVVIGLTHLSPGGELVRLFKCPRCNFRNIHEDEITHHIQYKDDPKHNIDVDKIDRQSYVATKKESRYHYTSKEDLPDSTWPWIKCLWCDYRDKLPRDLEWHFLVEHKDRLYATKVTPHERIRDTEWRRDPFSWMYSDLEYRLFKASRLAERMTTITQGY